MYKREVVVGIIKSEREQNTRMKDCLFVTMYSSVLLPSYIHSMDPPAVNI